MRLDLAVGIAAIALGIYLAASDDAGDGAKVERRAGAIAHKITGGNGEGGHCALRESPAGPLPLVDGCRTLASDDASEQDPEPIWGAIDCSTAERHARPPAGGDPAPRADGMPQTGDGFRRLRVIDGDDVYGERCELGENERDGPTAFYREGERRLTFVSARLPAELPLDGDVFQALMQMKQAQPSDNGGGTPVLALEAWDDRWRLRQSDSPEYSEDAHEIWSAPARRGVWTRFAFDATYSQDPARGSVRVFADLNGDGDFGDGEERSEAARTYTLKTETADGDDGIDEGDPIPSHLRVGLYHNPEYECPPPAGCYVELDNIQVLGS